MSWTDLCAFDDVPPAGRGGKYVIFSDRGLAVFRMPDDSVRVLDDACPHAGGSLSAGVINHELCAVCPWHGWEFNVDTGVCPDNHAYRVRTYPARVENGRVQVMRGD